MFDTGVLIQRQKLPVYKHMLMLGSGWDRWRPPVEAALTCVMITCRGSGPLHSRTRALLR